MSVERCTECEKQFDLDFEGGYLTDDGFEEELPHDVVKPYCGLHYGERAAEWPAFNYPSSCLDRFKKDELKEIAKAGVRTMEIRVYHRKKRAKEVDTVAGYIALIRACSMAGGQI